MEPVRALPRILLDEYRERGLGSPIVTLAIANLGTIVFAIAGNWNAGSVIFIYWVQSIVIGLFAFITILTADISAAAQTAGAPAGRREGTQGPNIRRSRIFSFVLAVFFAFHYGFFHAVYYQFIVEGGLFGPVDLSDSGMWLSCGLFLANHLYSFLYYRDSLPGNEKFIGDSFMAPYLRIVPMHLTIIFGAFILVGLSVLGIESTLPVLVLFLLLKTSSDISMHLRKHEA